MAGMGGPSDRTEQRRAWSAYNAAARRLETAMARVRELGVVIEAPAMNKRPQAWSAEQWRAMREYAVAVYELAVRRQEYEAAWGKVPAHG